MISLGLALTFPERESTSVIRSLFSVVIAMIGRLGSVCAKFKDLLTGDAGQDLVEYAFIILLVALATIVAMPPLATALEPLYNSVSNAL